MPDGWPLVLEEKAEALYADDEEDERVDCDQLDEEGKACDDGSYVGVREGGKEVLRDVGVPVGHICDGPDGSIAQCHKNEGDAQISRVVLWVVVFQDRQDAIVDEKRYHQ